ncbi:ATP-binding protein [Agrobacterium sp. Azo12]|uniref:ATP-binding protein n=1 Tax=Agrobacterium sp. Azo12 TaxID=3031129 RepID=UPI0023D87081|nr:ATP-binding protein [Agrobacterium sp. Azo12]MDO5898143.1 ATP-binding protein [Agrobacterium sp. Azo12]
MIHAAHASGEVIRKAGKSTAVLQVFAVILLALLAWVYSDISKRYAELQDGIKENALWSVYQLERESRRFEEELTRMILTLDTSDAVVEKLSLRYDILYSRMVMLDQARFEYYFSTDTTVQTYLQTIRSVIFANAPLFDAIAANSNPDMQGLELLLDDVTQMTKSSEQLLNYSNNALSIARAENRTILSELARASMLLTVLIIVCVVFLIYTLRRQLKNVREAGLSLEAMARRINDAYHAAEAGNRAKSQFMATIGHEIRTPLNAILGMVELLKLKTLPDHVVPNIKTIQRSGEALLDIINEILDFSKIEHGKLELEYRTVNLVTLIDNTIEMMRGRATDGGNTLLVDMPVHLPAPNIMTDPTRLRQIVLNLLGNAVKFTSNGSVTLVVKERETSDGLRLRIEVRDTGIGIDTDGMARLFQPFSQVDASISRKYGGTGLGLTICKQIVAAMNGEMGVDSILGQGSTFWLEVPVEYAMASGPATSEAFETLQPSLPRLDILVVEDNLVNQQVAMQFLKHLGQNVTLAENGAIAVEVAASQHFDMIFMDMQMPVMDGIEATQMIRSGTGQCANALIYAMTANASDQDRERCLQSGMDGFQLKPIKLQQLHELISQSQSKIAIADKVESDDMSPRAQELIAVIGRPAFDGLVLSFFDDAVLLLDDTCAALKRADHIGMDACLHTLKGAAANLGFDSIAHKSQALRGAWNDISELNALSDMIDESRKHFVR